MQMHKAHNDTPVPPRTSQSTALTSERRPTPVPTAQNVASSTMSKDVTRHRRQRLKLLLDTRLST